VTLRTRFVTIVTGYGQDDRGRVSSAGMVKNFLHVVQIGTEVHPASYPMGTGGGSFPVLKAAES
jgi:hypothetical protein